MRYCLCLCVHILSLVHVVSLDICEVKIVAQACVQKISELPTGIEPVSLRFPLGVQIFSEYKLELQSLLHIYPSLQHVLDFTIFTSHISKLTTCTRL